MRNILLIICLSLCSSAYAADSSLANFICDPVTNIADRAQCIERAAVVTRHDTEKISEGSPWLSMVWPVGWWIVYYAFGLLIGRYISAPPGIEVGKVASSRLPEFPGPSSRNACASDRHGSVNAA
jgi:hypothetical protein